MVQIPDAGIGSYLYPPTDIPCRISVGKLAMRPLGLSDKARRHSHRPSCYPDVRQSSVYQYRTSKSRVIRQIGSPGQLLPNKRTTDRFRKPSHFASAKSYNKIREMVGVHPNILRRWLQALTQRH